MVAGFVNSGISLGAMTGPLLSGVIIDALSYVWTLTILAFAYLLMVSILLRNFHLSNLQRKSCGRSLPILFVHGYQNMRFAFFCLFYMRPLIASG